MKKLVLIITIIFSLSTSNIAFAQSLDDLRTQLSTQPMENCENILIAAMDLHQIGFLKFLDETFRNKSSNSSLINIAIARFTQYRLALKELFSLIKPVVDYTSLSEDTDFEKSGIFQSLQADAPANSESYEKCYNIMQDYVENAKDIMIEHIKNNTAQKKTLTILEKYESINEKMRTLNFEIAQMYGYFTTFNDKLQWINSKCVQ